MYTIIQTPQHITITAPGYVETINTPFGIQASEWGLDIYTLDKHFCCKIEEIIKYNNLVTSGIPPAVIAAKIQNITKALASNKISITEFIVGTNLLAAQIILDHLNSNKFIAFEYITEISITTLSRECRYNGINVPAGFNVKTTTIDTLLLIDGNDWTYTITGHLKAANFKIYNNQALTAQDIQLYLVSKGFGAVNVYNPTFFNNDVEFYLENASNIPPNAFSNENLITGLEDLAAAITGTIGTSAFAGPTTLQTIKLDWAQSIGTNCFDNATSIAVVSLRRLQANGIGGNIGNNNSFSGVSTLTNLTIHAIHAKHPDVLEAKTNNTTCITSLHFANQ